MRLKKDVHPSSSTYAKFRQQILYPISILIIDPEDGKQKTPLRGKINSFLTPRIGNRLIPGSTSFPCILIWYIPVYLSHLKRCPTFF
ncbi:hypothetical protein FKM82_019665 [Ascaphus truei]